MSQTTTNSLSEFAEQIYSFGQVTDAICGLANTINHTLPGQEPLLVLCLLNGGLVFTGQLLPHLTRPVELSYVHATRYHNNVAGAQLRWISSQHADIKGKSILLCDDIFDEGKTLHAVFQELLHQGAGSVHCAVMTTKDHPRKPAEFRPEFSALTVADRYVFGMGMDYSGLWRNAPGIYAVKGL
jgi:hypoxanthine phosphoribosyltransferase